MSPQEVIASYEALGWKLLRWTDRTGAACSGWRAPDGSQCAMPPDELREACIYADAQRIGAEVEALNKRILRNRRQWAADEAAERLSKSRTRSPNAQRTNIHE